MTFELRILALSVVLGLAQIVLASHAASLQRGPEFMTDVVDSYINTHRPVLCRGDVDQLALWVSSTTGRRLTTKNLGTLISKITRETVGVDVSPHLFRTAGASTASIYGGSHPYLASAVLAHRDPRVTEEHYNRAMSSAQAKSMPASPSYTDIRTRELKALRRPILTLLIAVVISTSRVASLRKSHCINGIGRSRDRMFALPPFAKQRGRSPSYVDQRLTSQPSLCDQVSPRLG